MKAYLWCTNDGKASWTITGRQRRWQGTKPASGKIANCFYSCQKSLFHNSSFMVVDSALQITPTSCTYLLAGPFWWKKNNRETKYLVYLWNLKQNTTAWNQCVHFFITNHYIIWSNVLVSFHAALFKSCNYRSSGNFRMQKFSYF